jgi:hypothetical protein
MDNFYSKVGKHLLFQDDRGQEIHLSWLIFSFSNWLYWPIFTEFEGFEIYADRIILVE